MGGGGEASPFLPHTVIVCREVALLVDSCRPMKATPR